MTYDEIITKITSGLTGEAGHDYKYLKDQIELYRESEYSVEIARACGRLIYKCIPDDVREKLHNTINKNILGIESAIEEADFNLYKGNTEKAEKILKDMVTRIESLNSFKDDKLTEYHTFTESMQKILYDFWVKPKKEIKPAFECYSALYLAYGTCLHELGKYPEALNALEKGLRWNPADVNIMFEYSETWKQMGDVEKFLDVTRRAFFYAYKKESVARCCRNAAYYFSEKKNWLPAMRYLELSQQYEQTKAAQSEMFYIQNSSDIKPGTLDYNSMAPIASSYGLSFGPNEKVIGIAFNFGKNLLQCGRFDEAQYFAEIANNLLFDSKETQNLLKEIKERNNNSI